MGKWSLGMSQVWRDESVFGKQSWVERAGGCGACRIAWLLLVHPSVLASMGRGSLGVGGPRRARDRKAELKLSSFGVRPGLESWPHCLAPAGLSTSNLSFLASVSSSVK